MLGWNKNNDNDIRPVVNSIGLIQIDISNRNLDEIYGEIFNYTKIQVLTASRNKIWTLPEKIGNLKKLKMIDLSHNKLSTVPRNLEQCSRMLHLYLQDNRIVSLPEELSSLKTLKFLRLEDNLLEYLPKRFGLLNSLSKLDLSRNSLINLPNSLVYLKQLVFLDLSENAFVKFPDPLRRLQKLEHLVMNGNKLDALSSDLTQLKSLKVLDLSSNHFCLFPSSIGDLAELRSLNLSHNQLTHLSSRLCKLKRLASLQVSHNYLKNILDNFPTLQLLDVDHNDLVSVSLLNVPRLQILRANYNHLVEMPRGVYRLKWIEEIHLSENKIEKIAPDIGYLKSLKSLDLSNNQIKLLPKALYDLKGLEKLVLSEEDRSRRRDPRRMTLTQVPVAFHVPQKKKKNSVRKFFSFKKKPKRGRLKNKSMSEEMLDNVVRYDNREENNDIPTMSKSEIKLNYSFDEFSKERKNNLTKSYLQYKDKKVHNDQYSSASTISLNDMRGSKYRSKDGNGKYTPKDELRKVIKRSNKMYHNSNNPNSTFYKHDGVYSNNDLRYNTNESDNDSFFSVDESFRPQRKINQDQSQPPVNNRHTKQFYQDDKPPNQQTPFKILKPRFPEMNSPNFADQSFRHVNFSNPYLQTFSPPLFHQKASKDYDAISTTVTVNDDVGDKVSLGDDDFEFLLEDVKDDKLHDLATEVESLINQQLLTPYCL